LCTDCYTNCGGQIISDKCVKYTGPDIEFLDLETGDQLSQVEATIIEKLEGALDGSGIELADLETCAAITTALDGNEETLANIVQAISDVLCDLKEEVTELSEEVNTPVSFSGSCLTLGSNPTRDQVLQAVITKLCSLSTSVETIATNYVTTDVICDLVEDCLSAEITQEYTKMPKYVAMPYHGPLSVFDSQGKGLEAAGYDKVYICNGQTVGTFTTPDYRGRSPIGTNQGVPGGALDTAVDPSLAANAGYIITAGTKKGSYTDTLTLANTAPHTHTSSAVSIPLNLPGQRGGDNDDHNNMTAFAGGDKTPAETSFNFTLNTVVNVPASTSSSSGGGSPHNSTHPVIGSVFVMYVP
jgi:hypothetical protein